MKLTEICLIVAFLLALSLFFSGCEEDQWGEGELPAKWQENFGDSNISRINFVQTQRIDQLMAILYGIDAKDPNGQVIHKAGLAERVMKLEDLCIKSGDKVNITEEGGWGREKETIISKKD